MMTLTSEGFVPREEAGASESADGGQPELAHSETRSSGSSALTTYIAIATIAGLSVGGAYLVGKRTGRA